MLNFLRTFSHITNHPIPLMSLPFATLSSGSTIPLIGLGTWQSPQGLVKEAVKHALLNGYRHIDCAAIYENEEEVGEAFQEVFSGAINREDVFITSKLWNSHHKPEDVRSACEKSLSDLKLEYLDLYLIHWPIAFLKPSEGRGIAKVPLRDTWAAMEQLVRDGLVKSIGVSNFSISILHDLLTYADILPSVNQVEINPYNTQDELVKYCNHVGVHVTAYCPIRNFVGEDADPVLTEISRNYAKTPAQIALRWGIQNGLSVIPKSTNPSRIDQNQDILDFELSEEEMARISALNRNDRYCSPNFFHGVASCFS